MRVAAIEARPLRSLNGVEIELGDGITSLIGPNGSGKTNLLEALHFALTGRSFRTSDRRELIPFGEGLARASALIRDSDGVEHRLLASVSRAEGRRHLLDGSPVDAATAARHRPPVAVFAPDRMVLIKGPPTERRAELDRFTTARWPAREGLRKRYGQALAQRNALLGKVSAGVAPASELDAWDGALAEAAEPLIAARAAAAEELAPSFAAAAEELGLEGGASLAYAPRCSGDVAEIRRELAARREQDTRLGRTSSGPHLDELKLEVGSRALRRYGSQGQQRLALLSLLFAEREALLAARRVAPMLLLDDVMSELDPTRRERLTARLEGGGQTLVTAADAASVPERARTATVPMPPAPPAPAAAEAA